MTQGIEMGFVSLVHPSVGMFEGLWREGLGISEPSWGQRRAGGVMWEERRLYGWSRGGRGTLLGLPTRS